MNPSHPNLHRLALLFIVLVAVSLRLAYLSQPMRYDEAFTFLNYASKPLLQALTQYDQPNNHLFHTLLVHISIALFGDQPWAIRLPAFFAGIALVPLVYAVTRQHYNAGAGLLAAGLVASSSVLIEFSTNARGYTLVCCLFIALLGIAHTLKKQLTQGSALSPLPEGEGSGVRVWATFAVLAALGMYTIPTMLYPLGIVVVWLALSIENRAQSRRLYLAYLLVATLLAACLTLALYLPVIVVSGLNSLTANEWVQPLQTFPLPVRVVAEQAWRTWNRDIPAPLQVVLVAGFVASLAYHRRIASYRIPVIVSALLWLIPVLIAQRVSGFPRTWLFLLPLYFMMASAGVVYLMQIVVRRVGTIWQFAPTTIPIVSLLIALILGVSVLSSQSVLASEETGALPGAQVFTHLLAEQLQEGDGILALRPADAPLEYYFRQAGLTFVNTDLASKARLFVIVYEPAQSLADTLTRAGLSASNYTSPQRIEQIGSAILYLLVNQTLT